MYNSAMVIKKQQLNNIAIWVIEEQSNELPGALQGIFFMDGNSLPDDCITMYNSKYDAKNLTFSEEKLNKFSLFFLLKETKIKLG